MRVLAVIAILGCLSCAPRVKPDTNPFLVLSASTHRLTLDLDWPPEFEFCLEMERSGQTVCQDLGQLRAQFARIHKVQP